MECPEYHKEEYVLAMKILFMFQTPLLCFITYCVIFHSTAAMKNFRKMLLHQIFWLFLNELVVAILVVPVNCSPAGGTSANGFLNYLGVPPYVQYHLQMSVLGGVVASTISMLENRFNVAMPPYSIFKINNKIRLVVFIARLVFFTNLAVPMILFADTDQTAVKQQYTKMYPCLAVELNRPETFLFAQQVYGPLKYVLLGIVVLGVSETLFYSIGTFWTLRKPHEILMISKSTRLLQKKFFKAVLIQEIVPWVFAYQPKNVIALYVAITGVTSSNLDLNNLSTFLMTTHGIWASLSLLIVVNPYRQFVLGIFGIRQNRVALIHLTSTSGIHSSSNQRISIAPI
ncbi:unnamed protein product [Caenorhabditis auriculariae]|uniref:Uncharacterized protein n=1 Tax=Caenorhabditis auriculariae TaxID=2777116 RepID=A0A8S1HHD4_9PELO|nr:unnamed protein product [Caenorhabditis auriculariae]